MGAGKKLPGGAWERADSGLSAHYLFKQLASTWVIFLDMPSTHLKLREQGRGSGRTGRQLDAVERGLWRYSGLTFEPTSATSCMTMGKP